MRYLVILTAAALAVSAAAAVPAFAQAAPQPSQKAAKTTPDPNEVVCEKEHDSSSRLIVNKVCKTRAEWAEQRRTNRMDLDRLQTQRACSAESGSC
jgi:invasion protein IalB